MYERYLRVRSTATRLEYMRHPRPRNPKTLEEGRDLAESIGAATSPMLVIIGALDRLIPNAERLHARVPHAEYVVLDDAPHNAYWETADAWNQAVSDFLTRNHAP